MHRLSMILSTAALLLIACNLSQLGGVMTLPDSTVCTPNTMWEIYTIAAGDTLSDIAQRSESTVDELMAGNCLTDSNTLIAGQALRVPRTPTASVAAGQRGALHISVFSQPPGVYRLIAGSSVTFSWEGIPSEVKDGEATVEFILISPSGEEQIIGTTTGIIVDATGGYASTPRGWIVPSTPMTGAKAQARVNNYYSNTLPIEIVMIEVHSFTADRDTVQPGDTLTLSWSVSGGSSVILSDHTSVIRVIGENLPLSGSLTITVPPPDFQVNVASFVLTVNDQNGSAYTLTPRPEVQLPLVIPTLAP